MNKLRKLLLPTYFTVMGSYGFYRGFYNKYDNIDNELYIDKIMYSLLSTCYYLNPIFHPTILYYTIKRNEKKIRNLELTNDDWKY